MSKPNKIRLIFEILIWNFVVNLSIRWIELSNLLDFVTPSQKDDDYLIGQSRRVVSYVDFVLIKCRFLFRKTCLKRSVILYRFLRRSNYEVDLHIGVKKNDVKVAAHSWLTHNGQIFADTEEHVNEFTPVFVYPN